MLQKQIIASVFLFAFALQTFNKALYVFDYFTNTKSYAENCENKARPEMHCDGKCQLMLKLKKEENKDQQNPDRKAENKNEITLSYKSYFPALSFAITTSSTEYAVVSSGKTVKRPRSLLRPPIC